MTTSDIVDRLNFDSYFGGWNDGKGMNPWTLSKQLKRYRIEPKKVRIGDATLQGYRKSAFERVWARYSGTPEHPSPGAKNGEKSPEHSAPCSGDETPASSINTRMFRCSEDSGGDTPKCACEEWTATVGYDRCAGCGGRKA